MVREGRKVEVVSASLWLRENVCALPGSLTAERPRLGIYAGLREGSGPLWKQISCLRKKAPGLVREGSGSLGKSRPRWKHPA